MIIPSLKLNARDFLKLGGAGLVVFGKSLLEAAQNLIGALCLFTLGLIKALKIIK